MDRLVAIDSFILVRRVHVKRLPAVISDAATDPARDASDAKLFATTLIEQFVRFRRQLPVHPSSPDQNPPTVRLTSPKCHPDRQSEHGQKFHQPSTIDLTRDDATAIVRATMVAGAMDFEKFLFRALASILRLHDHFLDGGRSIEKKNGYRR